MAVELCGRAQRTFLVVLAPDREGWSRPLLPGGFEVSARVTGAPPFDWTMAEATVDEVDVPAGADREVEVRLYPAGMVTVAVSTARPVQDGEAPHVSLATCEPGASAWRSLRVSAKDSPQRRVAWSLAPGSTYVVEDLFLPGPRRLRVQAAGWRTVEAVLDVRVGRETTWDVVLEPEGDRAAPTRPPRARAPRR